jgi:hypothetical protein
LDIKIDGVADVIEKGFEAGVSVSLDTFMLHLLV